MRYIAVNQFACAALGYTREELLADVPQEQIAEELRWGVRRYLERRG